nr:sigma 54-interacting transcriptional regulator [Desulfobulbaceae bacterium]
MDTKKRKDKTDHLRKKAEALLKLETAHTDILSPVETHKLIHELRTHQIELTLQNDELREIQLQLEESRSKYVDLYDYAPVGYFTFSRKGKILSVNLCGCRQLGREHDALLHKEFTSFLSQEDSDIFYLHMQKALTTKKSQNCTITILPESGKPFFAQLDTIPSASAQPDKPQYRTAITDIDERKKLEEERNASKTRYRRLFEVTREGIVILDAETGQITDVNPFMTEILGYSYAELQGKKLWDIGLFQDVKTSKTAFQQLQTDGYLQYQNLPLETKGGRTIAVEFVGTIFYVGPKKVIQCHIRDITGQKLRHEASAKAHDGSERRVLERRLQPREIKEEMEQRIRYHKKAEKALLLALAEIKTLKDRLVVENVYFHQEIKKKHQHNHIIGQSDGLKYVLYRAEQVAPTNATVLVLGETGTGKELIAGAIHNLSPRKDRPLITVNCAALPANLLESELFGREKGAFTGADSRQIGRYEIADGSTLCLDEIGELPLEMQAKLLRVIQHGSFERLGSSKTIKVDVRVVATTNRNLEEEILSGRFRKDLYYRLNVFPITVPPLRQRSEDIPLLVETFVERYAKKMGRQITSIPKTTMKALVEYPWPGNVRELESIIERSVILCSGPGFQLADKLITTSTPILLAGGTLKDVERNHLMQTLTETNWRIEGENGAAIILGLHPSTLRARMHKLGIVRPSDAPTPA